MVTSTVHGFHQISSSLEDLCTVTPSAKIISTLFMYVHICHMVCVCVCVCVRERERERERERVGRSMLDTKYCNDVNQADHHLRLVHGL